MRILEDLSQNPNHVRWYGEHTVFGRPDELPQPVAPTAKDSPRVAWNQLHMPQRIVTQQPAVEVRAAGGKRQHKARRNKRRLYRPQDQRDVQTCFVILDRETGHVLARVRGDAAHCEIEAEKLARSQGCELSDLRVVFEGELQ